MLLDYLREKVLRRVGFSEEAYIIKDPTVSVRAEAVLYADWATLREIAMLCCRGGILDGEQLIPGRFSEGSNRLSGADRSPAHV